MTRRIAGWWLMMALLGGVVWKIAAQNTPQVKVTKGFTVPYSDPKDPRKRILFAGDEAIPVMANSGLIRVLGFRITKFVDGDRSKPELIIEAPECIFDRLTYTASSSGPVKAYTANTNYLHEGIGFRWQQSRTNITLVLSNSVHTVLQRTNVGSARPPPTHIYSDRFRFDSVNDEEHETRVARYSERVRVVDELMELSSGSLMADIPTSGTNVNFLIAETNVVVTLRNDGGSATGGRAVYDTRDGRELIELTEHPVWTDGRRTVRAERFVMDRQSNNLLMENHVRIFLPREAGDSGVFNLSGQPVKSVSKSTNSLIEITADRARVTMTTTNKSAHDLVAEPNVVILSPEDNIRGTAGKATFSDATGRLDLTGDPKWTQGLNMVSGDIVSISQSNRSFSAIGRAFVRMDAGGLGGITMPDGKTTAGVAKGAGPTSQVVDIYSDRFDYRTNSADFSGHVSGGLIVGGKTNFSFIAQNISIQLTNNQMVKLTARVLTIDENPATSANTNLLKRQATVALLTIRRSPVTGLMETMAGEGGVFGEQVERGLGTNGPVRQSGQAELVAAQFNARTNMVDGVIAERDVILRRDTMELHSDRSVYVAGISNRLVEMTGNVWGTQSAVRFTNAPALLWELKNRKITSPQGWNILGSDKDLKSGLIPAIRPVQTPP